MTPGPWVAHDSIQPTENGAPVPVATLPSISTAVPATLTAVPETHTAPSVLAAGRSTVLSMTAPPATQGYVSTISQTRVVKPITRFAPLSGFVPASQTQAAVQAKRKASSSKMSRATVNNYNIRKSGTEIETPPESTVLTIDLCIMPISIVSFVV